MKPIGKHAQTHHAVEFERAARDLSADRIHLQLYVAGMGPRSTQAVSDLRRLRARYRCLVDIVDIYEQPRVASAAQIVAVPTLAREQPPRRRIVGTIGNIDHVARVLGLKPYRGETDG
ncbi:MAG: circadian clock KaiB family protein [Steroidobacteraceae bacterium]